jgi:hypothetical protein
MKQLTVWQGIGLLTAALQIGLIGRFWLEGMVLGSSLFFGAYMMLLVAMTGAKQPRIRWLLVVFLGINLFSWVSNFTIGVP